MLQEVVGPEGAQISSHRCETIRVWPVQVTIQRENEAGQAHLRPHRGKTVQVRFLRPPIWRTLPIEGTQMREPIQDEDRQIVRRLDHPDRLLPSKIDQHLVRLEYKESVIQFLYNNAFAPAQRYSHFHSRIITQETCYRFYPTVRESTLNRRISPMIKKGKKWIDR